MAHKVRLLRVIRGWSQEELASASGLHRTSISLIERAGCSVSLDTLELLANTFGIALPELLDAMDPADVSRRLFAASSKTSRKKRSG